MISKFVIVIQEYEEEKKHFKNEISHSNFFKKIISTVQLNLVI